MHQGAHRPVELIIGLEVHARAASEIKLLSGGAANAC